MKEIEDLIFDWIDTDLAYQAAIGWRCVLRFWD